MPRVRFVIHSAWAHRFWLFGASSVAALAVGCGHFGSLAPSPGNAHPIGASRARAFVTVPIHVHTWTYADRVAPAPDWVSVQPYLDYAMVGQSNVDLQLAGQIAAAGIGVVQYTNPNRQAQYGTPHFPDNLPSDYAHDCRKSRIYRTGYGQFTPPPGPQPTPTDRSTYLMDPHSAHLAASWADEVTSFQAQSGVTPVLVFEDTADSNDNMSSRPCHYDAQDWTNATNGLDTTMTSAAAAAGETVSIVYNGLGTPIHPSPTRTPAAFGLNATVVGGMAEDCYSRQPASTPSNPDPQPMAAHDSQWLDTEYLEMSMAAAQKMFVCNAAGDHSADADKRGALRLYVAASFLMTYDPDTSVLDELFLPASGFPVFPESQIVALDPLTPPPTQISDLLIGGVYARQYASCYVKGTPIGPCAMVVNPSVTVTHPFPFPDTYLGSLKLEGGGVLESRAKVKYLSQVPEDVGPRSAVIAYGNATPEPSPSPSPTPSPTPSPSATP